MRTVYLIRHAMPDIPLGERWCVGGLTDLPLSELGRLQAALLPFVPALRSVTAVFCSPLARARETALPLCPAPVEMDGLQEQEMGVWDGLPFTEIKEKYPALYAAREADLSVVPDGAEALDAVRERMLSALRRCLEESEGDIAVVSHRTAISTVIGHREALTHATYSVLRWDGERFEAAGIGLRADPPLNDRVCLALLRAAGADPSRIAHCRAVAKLSDTLCAALREKGVKLGAKAVHRAALLHDIAKGRPEHAALGGVWLRELGYARASELVRQHTEPDRDALDEAGLVFLADKCVREDRRVSLSARFAESEKRCQSSEARAAHARRYHMALKLKNEINTICGKTLVE